MLKTNLFSSARAPLLLTCSVSALLATLVSTAAQAQTTTPPAQTTSGGNSVASGDQGQADTQATDAAPSIVVTGVRASL